jgi:CubicO group peptidase (beta-lactamase class C family)
MIARRHAAAMTAALFFVPGAAAADDREDVRNDVDAFIREALSRVEVVPGLAIAVVNGDDAVIVAGYGVADLATGLPVDADTRFYIASSTKSFTALAIAAMAERGEVELDAPLADWAAPNDMADALASTVSLTDLLSHRSGLDNAPMSFRAAFSGEHTPEIMHRLLGSTVARADTPHGTFRYSNAGYNMATTLIEDRFGFDWRDLVEREVLAPLGMNATTARISVARDRAVVAAGHLGHMEGGPVRGDVQKVDETMQSAGGLVSSARDMAIWLEAQINDGVVDGRRVFPEGLIDSTHASLVAEDRQFGSYTRDAYGLGWQIGRYEDDILISHFGNFAGSRAHVSFMPDRDLGVVVMVNEDAVAGRVADMVANYVYDHFAGRADLESAYEGQIETFVTRVADMRSGVAEGVAERADRPWMLAHPNAAYVGRYVSPAMGTVEVSESGGDLMVRMGVLTAKAEAFTQPETIRVEMVPLRGEVIRFDGDRLIYNDEVFLRR